MSSEDPSPVRVSVENVGGIDECSVTLSPGVTVLVGRNATNRTSLLSAIAGVLGGSDANLKTDATAGRVDLEVGSTGYHRTYERRNGEVRASGHPYVDDEVLVDTCVSLLESNPARRAVERDEDLRDVLLGPVDTAAIEESIREKESELAEVRERLERIDRRRERLPELEQRRRELEERLGDLTADVAAAEAAIDEYDASPAEAAAAEEQFGTLESKRERLREVRDRIGTQEKSIDALERERSEVELGLSDVDVDPERIEQLDAEISRLRDRERRLTDTISDLTAIVEFNEDLVEGEATTVTGIAAEGADVTAALDPDGERVECWTCGSDVPRAAIRERVEGLRETVADHRERRSEIADRLSELRDRKRNLRDSVERREELAERLEELERRLERRRETLADLRERAEELEEEVDRIEADLAEREALVDSDLLEKHRRVTELEYERGQVEQELSAVQSEISEIEGLLDNREHLEARRSQLADDLADLRTRVEDVEREAVESFNEHMAALLDELAYENVERVWIERVGEEDTRFDLHVVRSTETGAMYEDAVDTLSESEREVIGLVVALVGYLVHETHESVPFLLLDSLEAIDADRIETLLSYFGQYATYLVVALLPEDAAPIDEDYDRIHSDVIGA